MPYRKYLLGGLAALMLVALVGVGAYSIYRSDIPVTRAVSDMRYQIVYPCGKTEMVYDGPVLKELRGMDVPALREYYGIPGLEVSYDPVAGLVVTQRTDDLCAEHAAYRHLGICDGYVAVYEGPLGRNERVLQVEEIEVSNLSAACRQKLQQAAHFAEQAPETQAQLKKELEFATEEALNAALENLDELKD